MSNFDWTELFGIGVDRDIELAGTYLSHDLELDESVNRSDDSDKSLYLRTVNDACDTNNYAPLNHISFERPSTVVNLDVFLTNSDEPDVTSMADEPNVSSNSSWTSTKSAIDPLERFYNHPERHEEILLSIPVVGIAGSRSLGTRYRVDSTLHLHRESTAKTSSRSQFGDEDDSSAGDIDLSHPLGRYVNDIQDHELLNCCLTGVRATDGHAAQTASEDAMRNGTKTYASQPDHRDASPESHSSISLHPSNPDLVGKLLSKDGADEDGESNGALAKTVLAFRRAGQGRHTEFDIRVMKFARKRKLSDPASATPNVFKQPR